MRRTCEVWCLFERTYFSLATCLALAAIAAPSQSPAQTPPEPRTTISATHSAPPTQPVAPANDGVLGQGAFTAQTIGGEIKEDQLRQLLAGKTLYLRGGYQDNNLEFDEHGRFLGHSPKGSFTLSQVQINKVKLSRHKLELQGDRYALHFLGAAPFEDPTAATDKVKITPKKKSVHISFAREEVEKPKKKDKNENKQKHPATNQDTQPSTARSVVSDTLSPSASASQAQASQSLLAALDTVFSVGIDDRMIAAMPDFWKLYYQAAAQKTDYIPTDPGVLRQNAVDQKAQLISAIDPPSNEFAQANGVAGIALYHAVIGSDGKVQQVVAGRPIGFGLDESAEQTIRKATFRPAIKNGKPVPVALDLVVSFRIYSKRTAQPAPADLTQKQETPALPGPYTAQSVITPAASSPDN